MRILSPPPPPLPINLLLLRQTKCACAERRASLGLPFAVRASGRLLRGFPFSGPTEVTREYLVMFILPLLLPS